MPDRCAESTGSRAQRRLGIFAVPLAVFVALALMFFYALRAGDPAKLPSALIGKQVPETAFPALEGLRDAARDIPGFSAADLRRGEVSVVNFFASWCVPCVQEHPLLMALGQQTGIKIYGVNYKDPTPGGRRFLGRYGNPYWAVGEDARGRAALDWGVYGMPETFVIDGSGRIVLKHVGPLTPEILQARVLPAIAAARARGGAG